MKETKTSPTRIKRDLLSTGAELAEVEESTEITEDVYSTGSLDTSIKEQSLIIDTEKGLVVITGCAHPGIVAMLKTAKELLHKNIYLAMGGFHHPPISVVKEFRELGVEKVAPSHCTGEEAIRAFEEEYKADFITGGAGNVIEINHVSSGLNRQ